jgi:hypothetical protein
MCGAWRIKMLIATAVPYGMWTKMGWEIMLIRMMIMTVWEMKKK